MMNRFSRRHYGTPLVALISGSYRPDRCGVADYTRCLGEALAVDGFQPMVVTSARSLVTAKDKSILPIVPLVDDWHPKALPRLAIELLKCQPKVVHIQHSASSFGHSHAFGLFPLVLKTLNPRIPVVVTAHEYGGWPVKPGFVSAPIISAATRWLEGRGLADREDLFLLSMSKAIIVTNQFHFDYIKSAVPGVAAKLKLVPIGPNITLNAPALRTDGQIGDAERARIREQVGGPLGLDRSANLICYFGFIHPVKGLEYLLEAFQRINDGTKAMHLVVIGGIQSLSLQQDEAEGYFQKLISRRDELGLGHTVTFTGYVSAEQVSKLLLASDICVLPFNHGVSLKSGSLLAAMTHGLPILATYTEATGDDLKDKEHLLLVPPRDSEALARGMRRLLDSPSLRTSLGKNARTLAQRSSWKEIAAEHVHLYNRMLQRE